ncbi:MAG: SurA N-terminal domain-containing protein [Eubacteriales bacterium]
MRFLKRLLPAILIMSIAITMSACNLVEVDPEKDAQRTVIKTKDEDILKKEYNNYLAYFEMMYTLNGYTIPTEEEELKTFREGILDTMVDVYLLKHEAIAEELDVDTSTIEADTQSYIDSFISAFETEEAYTAFIEERNLTREGFESFFQQFIEDTEYANAYNEFFLNEATENSDEEWQKTIATVDGEKLYKDQFYYKLMEMAFYYYMNYGQELPEDEESLAALHTQIVDDIVGSYLICKDAEKQGITLKDEDIKAKAEEIQSQYISTVTEEGMESFIKGYYLTQDKFDELVQLDAKTQLYTETIEDNYKKDVTITDEDIKKYYDDNLESYNTVSAKHILTEDEDFAKEISKTVTDADSFEKAFEKYSENEKIKEASDLGAFTFSTMVPEFATAAFGLEKGEVTKSPIKTEHGYHIIYVYDKENPTLEDKKDEIKETLLTTALTTKFNEYQEKLLSDVKVKKEEIIEPFETLMENLKESYKIKTYPKRVI